MSAGSSNPAVKCVAVIQCHIAHERCPGARCAVVFAERKDRFAPYAKDAVYYVPFSCGGCPGRRVSRLVTQLRKVMQKAGVEPGEIVFHLASCMSSDNAHYPPCPHLAYIEKILARKKARVVRGSRISSAAEKRREEGVYER
jgi:predicted metal-binding protein